MSDKKLLYLIGVLVVALVFGAMIWDCGWNRDRRHYSKYPELNKRK